MTASVNRKLAQTILNLIAEAKSQGLDVNNPVKLKVLGSGIQGDLTAPERYVIVSFAIPALINEVQLWLNPTNRLMFKTDLTTQTWDQIYELSDMFSGSGVVGGGGGASSSGSGTVGQPVQAVEDLQAMTSVPDKTLIYVENERAIYGYDSTSIDSGPGIIVPYDNKGRWLLVSNVSGTVTNLDGGLF